MGNPEENQVNQAIEHRSENAQRLHGLVCRAASGLNADDFDQDIEKINLLLQQNSNASDIIIERAKAVISDRSHDRNALMDALYLSSQYIQKLRNDKKPDNIILEAEQNAETLFRALTIYFDINLFQSKLFKKAAVKQEEQQKKELDNPLIDKNNITLAHYAVTTGMAGWNGFNDFFNSIILNIPDYFKNKLIKEQFTTISIGRFSILHQAIITGNEELYDIVADKLDELKERGIITPETYVAQWTTITEAGFSLLRSAVITGNKKLYDKVAAKLDELKKAGIITPDTYAAQWTTITEVGFSLLHHVLFLIKESNTTYYGNPKGASDILGDVVYRLVEIFDGKPYEFKKFLEQETNETKPRNLDNFIDAFGIFFNNTDRTNLATLLCIRSGKYTQQKSGNSEKWQGRLASEPPKNTDLPDM